MISQVDRSEDQRQLTATMVYSHEDQSSFSRHLIMIWLVGMLVLLPLEMIKLPFNMTFVEVWILMALPIVVLSFVRGKQIISSSYLIPMWLILVASLLSTFSAPAPRNSLIVIMKESYVFLWFITLTAVLVSIKVKDFRRILIIWTAVVFVHGLVILGQFLSPDFWRYTISFANRTGEYEIYRPSGLFTNANAAAFFQMLGFVPLLLISPSKNIAMILGMLLLLSMLLTGSMGAAIAFIAGLAAVVVVLILSGHLTSVIKSFGQLAVIAALFVGVLFFASSQNERYQQHFERIFLERAERSSEGRFTLWQQGVDAYLEYDVLLWGVGPENFREVGRKGKQLHNDFLAFSVERGLLGTLGLVLFAVLATGRALYMVLISNKYPSRAGPVVVVFLGVWVAAIVESQTHQIFHFRVLWIVLAFQEAILYKMTVSEGEVEPLPQEVNKPTDRRERSDVQSNVSAG